MTDDELHTLVVHLRERRDTSLLLLTNPPQTRPDGLCQQAADAIEALMAERDDAVKSAADYHVQLMNAEARAERAEMELKRHVPVGKYNGLDVEQWKERAERAEEALRDILSAYDWWTVDEYDRCRSVVSDALEDARAVLAQIEKADD